MADTKPRWFPIFEGEEVLRAAGYGFPQEVSVADTVPRGLWCTEQFGEYAADKDVWKADMRWGACRGKDYDDRNDAVIIFMFRTLNDAMLFKLGCRA